MKHFSIKQLLMIRSGDLSSRKRAVMEKHMQSCSRCSTVRKAIDLFLSPSAKVKEYAPSSDVYTRVMSYYDNALSLAIAPKTFVYRLRAAAPRLAAAGFIAVLVCGSLVYYNSLDNGAQIKASNVTGIVKDGQKVVTKGRSFSSGSRVETGDNSRIALVSGDMMNLHAGQQTSFLIKTAHKEKNTGKTVFNVVMDKGTVAASFNKNKNLEYTLKTPHATITSRGSQIVVKVDNDRTQLLMKSGSAVISSASGTNITAEEGNGYTILPTLSLNSDDGTSKDDIVNEGQLSAPDNDDFIE